jgi:hypothetical protein
MQVEADLRRDYEKTRRTSGLEWNKAKARHERRLAAC